jgi:AmmeMemoRadiSam system radical SAM enzyme/AmmeMemoRadiSam system protein B/AmmeMemoRadiSam system protein A
MKSQVTNEPLADLLDRHTAVGAPELCQAEGDRIRCLACGHRCLIGEGMRGICKVRYNEGGRLKVPFGYVAGLQCDPVEKKPFFHVHPGSDALTFGMMGCDFHCSYCQNWLTSQALRDHIAVAPVRPVTPAELVNVARRERARLVVSSYNEPLITAEWAVSVFREAKQAGLSCAFVSNGNATPEALDFLRPWIVAYKVDLKSFNDRNYRSLGGTLDSVTRTIRLVHERGLWLEVVTLIIPGFNDGTDELRRIAAFLASVSPDIPWHVTAFHKDYKMTGPDPTPPGTLIRAAEIGAVEGLRFIYAGNLPGQVGPWENTFCPSCRAPLIERYGYLIQSYRLTAEGCCPQCHKPVPGIWPTAAVAVGSRNDLTAYQSRLPRAVAVPRGEVLLPGARPLPVVDSPGPSSSGRTATMPSSVTADAVPHTAVSVRPGFTADQHQTILAAVAGMLRMAVAGQLPVYPVEHRELRDQPLAGAFVSLKRGRHLRSCCGRLGSAVPLHQVLGEAVARTVWEDERFPPVSPAELDQLEMELWLLHTPQPVQAKGEDRLQAVEVGRHGVQVVRGQSGALFLPGVATDNNWDPRRFLDQVCVKAGLYPTAWKDDATALFTFEGEVLRGRVGDLDGGPAVADRRGVCRAEDVPAFADFCRRELGNLLRGATPSYYFWGAPDGTINGLVLTLNQPTRSENWHGSQLSLRPGLPLQGTLFNLLRAAAQHLAAQGITPEAFASLQIGLTFLYDPALHGTVADPHLEGLDPARRAVLVLESNRAGLLFDPDRTAEDLAAEAGRQARVVQPDAAAVFSLAALTNMKPVNLSTAPRPVSGPAVRPAAAAGSFYEANAQELAHTVDRLLAGERRPESWPAAMVPHAGLKYSGAIAASVLQRLEFPRTIIVIGPKHTPHGVDWAVAGHKTWALPGGSVDSDEELARQLCEAIPGLEMDAAAHQQEHAIEVELPLLARLAPESRVVGIVVGRGNRDSCRRFAEGLAKLILDSDEKPLLLISSDMNHFAPDAATRELDALALAALERGDPDELYTTVTQHNISMCGVLPAVIVLETLRLLGKEPTGERVGYATTADVTGDTNRVVGYAGMLLG